MPTFHFYKANLKVGELVGADKGKLESLIVQHGAVEEDSLQKLLANGQDLSDILTKTIKKIYESNPEQVAKAALGKDSSFRASFPNCFLSFVHLPSLLLFTTSFLSFRALFLSFFPRFFVSFIFSPFFSPSDTLDIYLTNVVNDPKNPKFRKIRIENARFAQQVWAVPTAKQVLKFAGFKEGIEYGFLILPDNADLEALYIFQALISSYVVPPLFPAFHSH